MWYPTKIANVTLAEDNDKSKQLQAIEQESEFETAWVPNPRWPQFPLHFLLLQYNPTGYFLLFLCINLYICVCVCARVCVV